MNSQTMTAVELNTAIIAALQTKIAAHVVTDGLEPQDVVKSKKKIDETVAQFLIDSEKTDFAAWCETAPCKSIMRCINFIHALAHRETDATAVSIGKDLIAQSLILTARTLNSEVLPLELVKHQVIKGYESNVDISTLSKGKNLIRAQRRMSPKTALSMISNRAGKHGYMRYLGLVTRSDDNAVVINKKSPFYRIASALLTIANKNAPAEQSETAQDAPALVTE